MNYGQRYNTGQLDTAFKNAASMYEIFSGQTDYYIGINDNGKANNVAAWKSSQVDTRYGGYVIARSGFTNTLTRDEIKTALGFVASMDNIKQGFAPTNINTKSDDPSSWDNPFARYYAEEAPTFTTYEPLAYYTSFPDGPAYNPNYSFYDPNIRNSVGQPGPWGTQAMVFENEADNNVFLFYDHFSYDTGNGAILKGNANLKLKEGRKYNWDLTSETANLGLQTSGFSDSWTALATAEEQNKYAIDAIFSGKNLLSSGFSWYLTQKPNLSTNNFVYRSQASIIAYKDFSENSFIDDGGSFIFAEIQNPQLLQGSLVNCLSRSLQAKRIAIDSFWITQSPKGDSSIDPVKHYPSSFDGIASFENKFPDHIAYPKQTNRTKSKKTKEYGHSFPESPSLDLVTDVNGQGMPQQILVGSNGESATYYPNGHTGSASATKQDYDSSKQLKTQIGTGGAFTQKDSISLIYPDGSIGKTTENGVWNNTYDNFRYFTQADVETGVSHRFKDPTGSGYKFTYPANHSSKFGESFSVSTSENFSNLEPLNFNKQILPSNESENYTGARLKNQYITKSSAASSHNHSEHYRSSEPKNNYPSAVDTLYHINTVNFKTGSFKVKKLDTGAFTSSDVFEFDGRISVTNDREYFSLPRGGEFLVIQPSTPFVSANGYRCPTFAHQISVEFDRNNRIGYSHYFPRHIRYFEESGLRFFINQARAEDPRKKKINWQTQKRAFNAYSLQTLDFFSDPILYAGHKHSAYPLDYEDVTLNLGTSDFGVPTLNVFGAAQINSEIVNYSRIKQSDYLNSGKYDNLYQETNSDWELDTKQVNTRGIALDPVLRWGVQDGRFEEQVALDQYSNVASFGSQLVKNVPARGAAYLDFKAGYDQRILNLNNLPRVYGTPHSVKHSNVGNINSHPDISYLDIGSFWQNGERIDLTQADGAIYNESSNINYRLEFSGFVKAYGEPPEDQIVVDHVGDYKDLYQDPQDDQALPIFQGGSFNREYDETFYKYGDDGTLSIEISVRRRYKNRRPNIPNFLYIDLVAANYSTVTYDSILSGYASPSQNHFSEGIDDALKISTAGYPTRTPYEAYDINTYSPVPTERRDEQYNWHIENGALNTDQEKARRSL